MIAAMTSTRVPAEYGLFPGDPSGVIVEGRPRHDGKRMVELMMDNKEGVANLTRDQARALAVALIDAAGDPEFPA